jgi:hypothetical protein
MANPDATDLGVEPLSTQLAGLNMSAPAGGTPVADTDPSSFWQTQDASSFSYPLVTDFSAVNHPQPPTEPALNPQFAMYAPYADANTGAQQAYWSVAADSQAAAYTAQAGPSSTATAPEKPFKCAECGKSYRLQCELEYVRRSVAPPPPSRLYIPFSSFPYKPHLITSHLPPTTASTPPFTSLPTNYHQPPPSQKQQTRP